MLNWPQMPQYQMLSTCPTTKHAEILAANSNHQPLRDIAQGKPYRCGSRRHSQLRQDLGDSWIHAESTYPLAEMEKPFPY